MIALLIKKNKHLIWHVVLYTKVSVCVHYTTQVLCVWIYVQVFVCLNVIRDRSNIRGIVA